MSAIRGSAVPFLSVDSVDFSYGHVQVLFGVSLDVSQGETLALLGTNGAGKSTLLRVICGLETPTKGRVLLSGRDLGGIAPENRVHLGLGLVPGGRGVFADLTVNENLEIGAFILRRRDQRAWNAARVEMLELFPRLAERLNSPAARLSGGEQQQLALARAFMLSPALLCIDELSLGLAPVVVEALLGAVRSIQARGTTVVLVEQSLNIAASLCERAVFLEKGEVRFEGSTVELLERDDVARAVFFGAGGSR